MMKKIICAGMAVAMMAALAIPACATNATNETTVKFTYSKQDIDANTTDAYTITIPAEITLNVTDEQDTTGVGFTGTNTVGFSGVIGQESSVEVSVASTNGYKLNGGTSVSVPYKMEATTTSTGVTPVKDGYNGTDAQKMADVTSIGFKNKGSVTLSFADEGNTGIFGACSLTDTLTFSYKYDDTAPTTATTNFEHAPANAGS